MHIDSSKIPQDIQLFLTELNKTGDFWLVGGCVRDLILGRTPKDWDIVTTTPEVCEGRFIPIGKTFPVWQTQVGAYIVEIACARTEKKIGTGHSAFEVQITRSLEEDLLRRDLTINAMAWRPGEDVSDFYGAEQDINSKILRHVSPAFAEDPLRVFRVARFYSQLGEGWSIDKSTIELMSQLAAETSTLPADRVREEFHKVLNSRNPGNFFQALFDARALNPWFPESAWTDPLTFLLFSHKDTLGDLLLYSLGVVLKDQTTSFCARMGYGKSVLQSMELVRDNYNKCSSASQLSAEDLLTLWKRVRRGSLGVAKFILVSQEIWRASSIQENPVYPGLFLYFVDDVLRNLRFKDGVTAEEVYSAQIYALSNVKNTAVSV